MNNRAFRIREMVIIAFCIIGVCAAYWTTNAASPEIKLETRVLGQNAWLAGSTASLRVITLNHFTEQPLPAVPVEISIAPKGSSAYSRLYKGNTNSQGAIDASFAVPETSKGSYQLKVVTLAVGEKDEIVKTVEISRQVRVLLTTDKPLYQPGQIIHVRALALKIPSLRPFGGQPCTLEILDSKGNKVFKQTRHLSKFGVASVDFQLATEINKGAYTIRAIIDGKEEEKKVTVDRYVLPKFKVRLDLDKKYYLPGDRIRGTVHAAYFFGKPVEHSKVVVKLSKFDVSFNDFSEITGTTDTAGVFEFEETLPTAFVGQPLEQGGAFFKAEVLVTDGADHSESITSTYPVSKDALKVIMIPEAGRLVPDIDNIVYVFVSTPDGSPVKATFLAKYENADKKRAGHVYQTDSLGLGQFIVKPTNETVPVTVNVTDKDGHQASISADLSVRPQEESLILRTDNAISVAGQEIKLSVISSRPSGYVYLDCIKNGQTILTKSLPLHKGKGELTLPLTEHMAGTLELHAYRISRSGNIIRDTRTIYVNPASDLKITVSTNEKQYLPGKPAKIDFKVTGSNNKPLVTALGVSIVDESVYALQELQPGLERIYFLLEKELAAPKYEIHSITPSEIVKPIRYKQRALGPETQNAAKVLFAAIEQQKEQAKTTVFTLQADSYADKIAKIRESLARQAKANWKAIATGIKDFDSKRKGDLKALGGVHYLVRQKLLPASILKDQWGKAYEFLPSQWGGYSNGLIVWSYGPDRRRATVDDIVIQGYPSYPESAQVVDVSLNAFKITWDLPWKRKVIGFGGKMDLTARGQFADGLVAEAPSPALRMVKSGAVSSNRASSIIGDSTARPDVRVRSFFPETLYYNPSVITGDDGKAAINVDMADSITSWRLTAMGSSLNGLLGSTTSAIKVFQDFFIDIDLPVALTQNDVVSIPVAVYNYLPTAQKIDLIISKESWFSLDGSDRQTLLIPGNSVKGIHYRITVKDIGWHKLTVHAYGSKMNDAIRREIEVMPDGERQEASLNDRLEKNITRTVTIPANSIDGASNILVKIYPGIFSQVVEGMDSLLQMPFGCFEQTSSVTYPNILVLDYMRRTKLSTPEIQMKAEQYINTGYQRLLSYECKTGGFEWFGNDPANQVLTAYGLLEFSDMKNVYEVDENVIRRTQAFLIHKQNADGSWTPDKGGIAEGAINRQTDDFRTTAYILWSLASSDADPQAVNKGRTYLAQNWPKVHDAYALAVALNAFVATPDGRNKSLELCEKLADLAKSDDKGIYWTTEGNTAVSSTGLSADVETTALAALALMKAGRHPNLVSGALTYLIKSKDPRGTWGNTQATIFALKALISSMENRSSSVDAKVVVIVNGKEAGSFQLTPENSDVLRQVDCKKFIHKGDNLIEIKFDGKGSSLYQISSYCYMPWEKTQVKQDKVMDINVEFDRTTLDTNDIVTSTVTVTYNGAGSANMVIVDLGTPPGFDVLTEDLDALVSRKIFQKYSLTGRQTIIYIEKIEKDKPLTFKYRMKAKFSIKAKSPKSVVYQYYNPDIRDTANPVSIIVRK